MTTGNGLSRKWIEKKMNKKMKDVKNE